MVQPCFILASTTENISLVLVRGNHIQFLDNPIAHYNALLNYTILRHRDDYGTLQFENMELSFLRWNLGEYQLISVFNDKVRLFNLIYWVMSASLTLLLTLTWFLTRLNLQKVAAQRHVYIDNLTRLNNRHFLNKISTKFIEHPHSIAAMIDIDHFKKLMTNMGTLPEIAFYRRWPLVCAKMSEMETPLSALVEKSFTIVPSPFKQEAWYMLDRLRQRVKDDHSLYGTTISIGFTFIDGSLPAAISRADTALYQAKEAGRNQVVADSEKENDSAADLPIQC